jgi:predicted transposase YbfD/YdcC
MHLVSAFSERNHMVLGQLAVTDKSNEITAIPRLLQLLSLKDTTVNIDAMGCQKTIAQTIVDEGGDYLLAVKDNHKTLHEDIRFFFEDAFAQGDEQLVKLDAPQVDSDHGRLETRQIWASGGGDVGWLA